jgi:hypothetical protein
MGRAMQLMQGWTPEHRRNYGREILRFDNRLAETGLFTDEALARLFDEHPREDVDICTMQRNPPPDQTWIAGDASKLSGAEIVEAVRKGALWASARMAMVKHPRYRVVLDRMFEEFSKAIGQKIYSVSASVLVSGPQMGIFFHVDPAETMLWHVRGTKTLYVYPATDEGLPEQALEAILLKECLSDAPYRAEMEAVVTPVHLEAGQSVAWPLHGPHRVLNGPDLNVSVSCEYSTLRSLLTNGVFYANGRLRRATGLQPRSRRTPLAVAPAYWAAAKALKVLAPPKHNVEAAHPRQFDVDLSAPDCIRWREGYGPDADVKAAA